MDMPTHPSDANHIEEYTINQGTCPSCGGVPEKDDDGNIYVLYDGYTLCSECSIKWHVENDVV